MKEFGDSIGFHIRQQRNMSELVYDVAVGGTYIKAAIFSWGISDENLVVNVVGHLREQIQCTMTIP